MRVMQWKVESPCSWRLQIALGADYLWLVRVWFQRAVFFSGSVSHFFFINQRLNQDSAMTPVNETQLFAELSTRRRGEFEIFKLETVFIVLCCKFSSYSDNDFLPGRLFMKVLPLCYRSIIQTYRISSSVCHVQFICSSSMSWYLAKLFLLFIIKKKKNFLPWKTFAWQHCRRGCCRFGERSRINRRK